MSNNNDTLRAILYQGKVVALRALVEQSTPKSIDSNLKTLAVNTRGSPQETDYVLPKRRGGAFVKFVVEAETMTVFVNFIGQMYQRWVSNTIENNPEKQAFYKSRLQMALAMVDNQMMSLPIPSEESRWWMPNRLDTKTVTNAGMAQTWSNMATEWFPIGAQNPDFQAKALPRLVALVPADVQGLSYFYQVKKEPSMKMMADLIVNIYQKYRNDYLVDGGRVLEWLLRTSMAYRPETETPTMLELMTFGNRYQVSPFLSHVANKLGITLVAIHLDTGSVHWGMCRMVPSDHRQFQDELTNMLAPILDPWFQRQCAMFVYNDTDGLCLVELADNTYTGLQLAQAWLAHLLITVSEEQFFPGFRFHVLFPLALYQRAFQSSAELRVFQQTFTTMFGMNAENHDTLQRWIQSDVVMYEAIKMWIFSVIMAADSLDVSVSLAGNQNNANRFIRYYENPNDKDAKTSSVQDILTQFQALKDGKLANAIQDSNHKIRDLFTWPALELTEKIISQLPSIQTDKRFEWLFTDTLMPTNDNRKAHEQRCKEFVDETAALPSCWKLRHTLNADMVNLYVNGSVSNTLKQWVEEDGSNPGSDSRSGEEKKNDEDDQGVQTNSRRMKVNTDGEKEEQKVQEEQKEDEQEDEQEEQKVQDEQEDEQEEQKVQEEQKDEQEEPETKSRLERLGKLGKSLFGQLATKPKI